VIETLLKCPELEIIELCLELLFHICVPASAISANVTDDWVDSMEVLMMCNESICIEL
jgi:hypothetical protein